MCLATAAGCGAPQDTREVGQGTPPTVSADVGSEGLFVDEGGGARGLYGELAGSSGCAERVTVADDDVAGLAGDAYRRFTVRDGDDFYGERCELGRNERRFGDDGGEGTGVLFQEGERRVTQASFRLPANYPLSDDRWQLVMQMKQTQPAANGGGTPVLALRAYQGRWALMQSDSVDPSATSHTVWSAPARMNAWTRFIFDVTYSQDPELGSIKLQVDLNGDGDTLDESENSPRIDTYTLKREVVGGDEEDGIEPGESIPSHLRVGLYHHRDIPCPEPEGCSVEIGDVRVLSPG